MRKTKIAVLICTILLLILAGVVISALLTPSVSIHVDETEVSWHVDYSDRISTTVLYTVTNRTDRDITFRLSASLSDKDISARSVTVNGYETGPEIIVKSKSAYAGRAEITIVTSKDVDITGLDKPYLKCNIQEQNIVGKRYFKDRFGLLKNVSIESLELLSASSPGGRYGSYKHEMTFRVTNNTGRPVRGFFFQFNSTSFAVESNALFPIDHILQPGETDTGVLKAELIADVSYFKEHSVLFLCTVETELPGNIIVYREIPVEFDFKD